MGADVHELAIALPALAATLAHATARWAQEAAEERNRVHTLDACLTMEEAARRSGILEHTLREQARAHNLPVVRIGRWIYVRTGTLERFIEERERTRGHG